VCRGAPSVVSLAGLRGSRRSGGASRGHERGLPSGGTSLAATTSRTAQNTSHGQLANHG
jgi:hypothetical protein